MISKFTVVEKKGENNFVFVKVLSDDVLAFSWLDGFVEDMEETFGYKVTDKTQGPDGTGIYKFETDGKKIEVLFDEDWGIEIHPHDIGTEQDVIQIGAHLKDVLED